MRVWININKNSGFSSISVEIIGNIVSPEVADATIGNNTYKMIDMLNMSNYLDDDTRMYMQSLGWQENESYFCQNQDLFSYCFEK